MMPLCLMMVGQVAGPFCADGAPTSAPPVSANQHQLNTDDMQQLSAITGLSIDELKVRGLFP